MDSSNTYSVLIVGYLSDRHIQRLIRHLRDINPQARIDVLASSCRDDVPEDIRECISNLYVPQTAKDSPNRMTQIWKFFHTRTILRLIASNHYNVINIHYPSYYHYFYLPYFRKMTSTILLTPWGSDVYRVGKLQRIILKRLYLKADKVSSGDNRFSEDVKRIYKLPDTKRVSLDIGSDTIDYIHEHLDSVSKDDAKEKLDVKDKYIITCSYNGSVDHRHEIIIEAINKIKDSLSSNIILFFPFTYAGTEEYANKLKNKLSEYNLKYKFFESYLSVEDLFLIRRASDMFIHIQPSDANSQSLQEYLICGAKVVNGEWVRYKELEIDGLMPYFIVEDINSLDKAILNAYKSNAIIINSKLINYITSYGWKKMIIKWDSFFKSTEYIG